MYTDFNKLEGTLPSCDPGFKYHHHRWGRIRSEWSLGSQIKSHPEPF